MKLSVECYSGRKADERPVRFSPEGREYQVEASLDQWYDPETISFKVRAADGNVYILRQRTRRLRHRGIWLRFAGQTTNADTLMFQQVKSGPRGCRGYLRRELQICRP